MINKANSQFYSSLGIKFLLFSILLALGFKSYSQGTFCEAVGGTSNESSYAMTNTSDGGFIQVGSTNSYGAGGSDMYIVKYTFSGAIQWTRTVGGVGNEDAWGVIETIDGGFAVLGNT
jgi:hypothetical protein